VVTLWPLRATSTKSAMPKHAAKPTPTQVTICAPRSPIQRPKKPAMNAPRSGRKMAATVTALALHEVDVFDGDGAAIAEIADEDGKADCRLRRRHRQQEHGKDLADEIVEEGGE